MEEVKIENIIRDYRKQRDLTQEQLARKSQTSTRAIQNYEAGKRVPDVHTAIRIAEALNKEVKDVFPIAQT
jgi:putative transcriptional regulator